MSRSTFEKARRLLRGRPGRNGSAAGAAILTAGLLAVAACGGDAPAPPAENAPSDAGPPADALMSPPGTDVWVGRLVVAGDSVAVTELRNATRREGYDNQPAFTPDGAAIYYTRGDSAGGTDIWRYTLSADGSEAVTTTAPESEYSATPVPGAQAFTVVRVEADSTQRLWRFPRSGNTPTVLFPDLAPVGYHAWASEAWVATFVLGEPPTLQVAGGESGDHREVARDIGRSIRPVPGAEAVTFVQRLPEDAVGPEGTEGEGDAAGERATPTRIMRWSPGAGVTPVVDTPGGEDDHAWTPGGVLLLASGSRILAWREGWDGWREVGRSPSGGTVSRMDVSPDGSRIAVVIEAPAGG